MALIKCSECGGMLSEKVNAYPHCGAPISIAKTTTQDTHKQSKAKYSKLLVIVIALISIGAVAVASYYEVVIKPQQEIAVVKTMLMSGQVEDAYTKLEKLMDSNELE